MKLHKHARPAFTLLELLVVLAIIALLASITVSAVFRLQSGQKETNTNTHLRKIHMNLDKQWAASVSQISSEKSSIPDPVRHLTKNADGTFDVNRAMALHMKFRLRQEFPVSFSEGSGQVTVQLTVTPPGQMYSYVYKPKPSYVAATQWLATTPTVQGQENEAAAMLFLILSQARGGAEFNPEQIGPTTVLEFPLRQGAPAGTNNKLRVFVDEWGNPISFRRIADDDLPDSDGNGVPNIVEELSSPPYISPAMVASGHRDPQDPDGRLSLPPNRWASDANGSYKTACENAFNQTNAQFRPYILNAFNALNRGPYAFSAGKDKNYRTEDDLYSFRIARDNKGN